MFQRDLEEKMRKEWEGFFPGVWEKTVNVRDFIQKNYTPYDGDDSFLEGPTEDTKALWDQVMDLFRQEREAGGVLDMDTKVISTIVSHEILRARRSHIITGLPDAYGRGRIIGDYRRVALYGVDRLIEDQNAQKDSTRVIMYSDVIREREELSEQIRALEDLKKLGEIYGFDISRPAEDTREAIQWLYFGYLAAVKEQNGAAMSLGRTSTFIDIYAHRDLKNGKYTEREIQELVDHFIMKLRMVKFARTPEYNELFSGDPQWVTESIGGMGEDGRTLVTRTSYRYLQTLYNLGPGPEPNLTVLWSTRLPLPFTRFCAPVSIALFSGDPTWVTETIGGVSCSGTPLVTRTSYRFLNTLYTLGPAPEPNLTVLWSPQLPEAFRRFCAQVSIDTSSIQYENDELIRPAYSDDTAIACCVSAMRVGRDMQFFGARANIAKALLYAINGGRDEVTGEQVAPPTEPVTGDVLDYEDVVTRLGATLDWLVRHQRRRGRDLEEAGWPEVPSDHVRVPRLRRGDGQVQGHDEVAGAGVCQCPEHHPLHAR